MRIALLGGSLEGGGAQRLALRLGDALIERGHEVRLVTLDATCDLDLTGHPVANSIVRLSAGEVSRSTLRKVLDFPLQWWKLFRLLRRERISTVLSLQERSNIMNLLLPGRFFRVISVRSHPSAMLRRKSLAKRLLIRGFYGLFLGRADRIVLNSRAAADDFVELFHVPRQRVEVIYNVCDVALLRTQADEPLPAPWQPLFQDPVILTCGRMIPDKGHWQLVRAFREVLIQLPRARLIVVGQGPLEAGLKQLAETLGVADRVSFPGFMVNPAPWVRAATLFVLPSRREGFPNALLEALALGCPSIAGDCHSGPRELLAPETPAGFQTNGLEQAPYGWLVAAPGGPDCPAADTPLDNAERQLAQAMTRLLAEGQTREKLRRSGSSRALDFQPEHVIPQWEAVLSNAD